MENKPSRSKFHIGMRNIKTALAATLCALLYLPFDRNPTFACIGAIFGIGNDMESSKLLGGNRFFGTLIGGLIGIALFTIYIIFYPTGENSPLMLLFVFVGVVIVILISQIFSIYIGQNYSEIRMLGDALCRNGASVKLCNLLGNGEAEA